MKLLKKALISLILMVLILPSLPNVSKASELEESQYNDEVHNLIDTYLNRQYESLKDSKLQLFDDLVDDKSLLEITNETTQYKIDFFKEIHKVLLAYKVQTNYTETKELGPKLIITVVSNAELNFQKDQLDPYIFNEIREHVFVLKNKEGKWKIEKDIFDELGSPDETGIVDTEYNNKLLKSFRDNKLPIKEKVKLEKKITDSLVPNTQTNSLATNTQTYSLTTSTGPIAPTMEEPITTEPTTQEPSTTDPSAEDSTTEPTQEETDAPESEGYVDPTTAVDPIPKDSPSYVISYSTSLTKGIDYARKWAKSYNPNYKYFENDCTNYVSQILYAAGYRKTSTWTTYTNAWIQVEAFGSYLTNNLGFPSYVYSSGDEAGAASNKAVAGDVIQFYNITKLRYSHTVYATDKVWRSSRGTYDIKYCGHSSFRLDYSLIDAFEGSAYYTKLKVIKIQYGAIIA